ncbi:hypothetical protein E7Z54_17525, partial [Nocardioides sp.]
MPGRGTSQGVTLAAHPHFGRPLWTHLLAAVGLVVAWTSAFLVLVSVAYYFSASCVDTAHKGLIPAPASPRGELACGRGTSWFWVVVLALMAAAVVGAAVAWSRQHLVWLVVAALLAPGIPAGAVGAVALVRADCTPAEW